MIASPALLARLSTIAFLFGRDMRELLATEYQDAEASRLALAQSRGLYLASDERRAFLREIRARIGEARLLTTPGIFVLAIRARLLTVEAADAAKKVLEQRRFTMRFASFADVIGPKK